MNGIFSKRNSALLLLIIAIAASLSIVSYNYSAHTSEQIEEIAVHEIRSNAEIQVHDLSNSLANKLADVTNNLNIIAKSPSVRQADFESARTMIDNAELASEDILYFKDTLYTGKNVFGVRYQSFLSSLDPESVNSINSGFKAALHSEAGLKDTAIGDTKVTFAYQPVILEGQQFGVLYIFAPHGQATAAAALIDQQENLTMLMIIGIAASASGIIFVIFLWNKRLQQTVDTRTEELRKANEQLKAHDRMQQEFINIAAHELRTPVQPILGMTEMLESEMPDKSDDIKMIARNARRLQRLTEDILDVAKIESKSLKLKKTTFEIGEVMINLLNDYERHKIVNGDVRFRYEPKEEEVTIEADKDRITQVVSNLLDNALKFT